MDLLEPALHFQNPFNQRNPARRRKQVENKITKMAYQESYESSNRKKERCF